MFYSGKQKMAPNLGRESEPEIFGNHMFENHRRFLRTEVITNFLSILSYNGML